MAPCWGGSLGQRVAEACPGPHSVNGQPTYYAHYLGGDGFHGRWGAPTELQAQDDLTRDVGARRGPGQVPAGATAHNSSSGVTARDGEESSL